jgi:hypothetical protein
VSQFNDYHFPTEDVCSGSHIEFGAQQCRVIGSCLIHVLKGFFIGILVRDEAAREKLREQVGDIGLIMWVVFNDLHSMIFSCSHVYAGRCTRVKA